MTKSADGHHVAVCQVAPELLRGQLRPAGDQAMRRSSGIAGRCRSALTSADGNDRRGAGNRGPAAAIAGDRPVVAGLARHPPRWRPDRWQCHDAGDHRREREQREQVGERERRGEAVQLTGEDLLPGGPDAPEQGGRGQPPVARAAARRARAPRRTTGSPRHAPDAMTPRSQSQPSGPTDRNAYSFHPLLAVQHIVRRIRSSSDGARQIHLRHTFVTISYRTCAPEPAGQWDA